MPIAVIYWVASHNLRVGPSETIATVADWYTREFDSLAWAAIWQIPPFVLLSIICFVISRRVSRRCLAVVVAAGVSIIGVLVVPRTIHLIKDTYRRDNWGEGAEYGHFALCVMGCICLCVGLSIMAAVRRSSSSRATEP